MRALASAMLSVQLAGLEEPPAAEPPALEPPLLAAGPLLSVLAVQAPTSTGPATRLSHPMQAAAFRKPMIHVLFSFREPHEPPRRDQLFPLSVGGRPYHARSAIVGTR